VHLGEFGTIVAKGIHHADRLIAARDRADLPAPARRALNLLADQLVDTHGKITDLTADYPRRCEGERRRTAPADAPRERPDHGQRAGDDTAGCVGLQAGSRSAGLDRPRAEAACDGRQGKARTHLQDGRPIACCTSAPSPSSARAAGENRARTGRGGS